jgi:hypothetical protein
VRREGAARGGQSVFGNRIHGGEHAAQVAQELYLRVARLGRRRGLSRPTAAAPHA